jgi:HPt (histidine-containing phosphotransfer) domain-containing protein
VQGVPATLRLPVARETLPARHVLMGLPADSGSDDAVVDETALATLVETVGDSAFADELLAEFLDGLDGALDALRADAVAGDAESLRRAAHTLKSNAATFGARRLAERCRSLEAVVDAGDTAGVSALVDAVEKSAVEARSALTVVRDGRHG